MVQLPRRARPDRRAPPRSPTIRTAAATLVALAALGLALAGGAQAADGTRAGEPRRLYVAGIAAVAKGYPIVGGRVGAEDLSGRPLAVRWAPGEHRRTRPRGVFYLPQDGLPRHFVLVVRGGTVKGRPARGAFRAIVSRELGRNSIAFVSVVSSVHVGIYRAMLPAGPHSRRIRARAAARSLHALRLPAGIEIGYDDQVNPRIARGARIHAKALAYRGYGPLVAHLVQTVLAGQREGLGAGVRGGTPTTRDWADTGVDCAEMLLDLEKAMSECLLGSVFNVLGDAHARKAQAQTQAELAAIQQSLASLSSQVADLQAAVSQLTTDVAADFAVTESMIESVAVQQQYLQYEEMAQASAAYAPEVCGAGASGCAGTVIGRIATVAASGYCDPANPTPAGTPCANPAVANAAAQSLYQDLVLDVPGAVNPAATGSPIAGGAPGAFFASLTRTGGGAVGTLPQAWRALRLQQASGSLGSQPPGPGAFLASGQGTSLYTPEMSTAFRTVNDYWTNQFLITGLLSLSWNQWVGGLPLDWLGVGAYGPAQMGITPLGLAPADATAYAAQLSAGSGITANYRTLLQQTPMVVPPGTVIDPTTSLIWGTALTAAPGCATATRDSTGADPCAQGGGLPVSSGPGSSANCLQLYLKSGACPYNGTMAAPTAAQQALIATTGPQVQPLFTSALQYQLLYGGGSYGAGGQQAEVNGQYPGFIACATATIGTQTPAGGAAAPYRACRATVPSTAGSGPGGIPAPAPGASFLWTGINSDLQRVTQIWYQLWGGPGGTATLPGGPALSFFFSGPLLDWEVPEVSFSGAPSGGTPFWRDAAYQAGQSPALGALGGSGSGLLAQLNAQSDPADLGAITSPAAFPADFGMWAKSNRDSASQATVLGAGGTCQGSCGGSTAPVVMNAPLTPLAGGKGTAQLFAYPAQNAASTQAAQVFAGGQCEPPWPFPVAMFSGPISPRTNNFWLDDC